MTQSQLICRQIYMNIPSDHLLDQEFTPAQRQKEAGYRPDGAHITVAVKDRKQVQNKPHEASHGYTEHLQSFDTTKIKPSHFVKPTILQITQNTVLFGQVVRLSRRRPLPPKNEAVSLGFKLVDLQHWWQIEINSNSRGSLYPQPSGACSNTLKGTAIVASGPIVKIPLFRPSIDTRNCIQNRGISICVPENITPDLQEKHILMFLQHKGHCVGKTRRL